MQITSPSITIVSVVLIVLGIDGRRFAFSVISSPYLPSPLVAPETKELFIYVREALKPSILGCSNSSAVSDFSI